MRSGGSSAIGDLDLDDVALTDQLTWIVPSANGLAWRTALVTSSEITISVSSTTTASTPRARSSATSARRTSTAELIIHGTRRVCTDIFASPLTSFVSDRSTG
jgi:hypothetical protein